MRIKVVIRALTFLVISFVALLHAHGATLYVSTQGNDSNPGTAAQPFRTITHAYGFASPGLTIVVMPGTYTDYTSGWGIHLGANGTASSPIVLQSQVAGGAIIDGQNASDRNVGFYIDGTYNILNGFEIKNGPKGGITIWANNNQILNCNIHNNGNPASTDTNGRDGVYSSQGTSGNIYANNSIHHNGRTGSNLDHGLYLCGQNEMVLNNCVVTNAANGLQVAGYTTVSNMKVYNNVFAFNGANGIILWQSLNGIDIKNNILYQNGHSGIGSWAASGSGVNVDHNIFFGNVSGNYNFTDGGSTYTYTLGTAIYSDPHFVNATAAAFDPHLSVGSPAIQSGLDLYSFFTTDMTGAARPASGAWDLGPCEYAVAVTSPPITVAIKKVPGGMTISWNSVAGKIYRVSYKNDLKNAWGDLTGDISATAAATSWTDTQSGTVSQRFYRVYSTN